MRVILACAALLLSACSTKQVAGPVADADAAPGGTVRIGILAPRAIAPWLVSAYDPYGTLVVQTMCDPLVQLDPRSGEMVPAAAVKWRLQSPSVMILQLRKDLRFSDGRPVRSDDVITSISRSARGEVGSPVADLVSPIQGWGALASLEQASGDPKKRRKLVGISSPSPTSIEISLDRNRPDFFRVLGHTLASVVPERDVEADEEAAEQKPVCVGPYRLTAPWTQGQDVIRLERSPAYYGANRGYTRGGRGYADLIEFHVLPDAAGLEAAFSSGAVDAAVLPADATPRSGGPDLVTASTGTVEYVGFDTSRPPFDNPRVRVALSLALDRRAIAAAVAGGVRRPLTRFLPDVVGAGYGEGKGLATACRATAPEEGNLESAERVLGDAEVDLRDVRTSLAFNDEFANRAVVEAVVAQWRDKLGLDVDPEPMPWTEMTDRGQGREGFPGMFRFSWSPQVPEPAEYLQPLFASSAIGRNNFSRFAQPRFDRLIEREASEALEPIARRDKYLEAESMICLSMPMIPLLQGGRPLLVRAGTLASATRQLAGPRGNLLVRELYGAAG